MAITSNIPFLPPPASQLELLAQMQEAKKAIDGITSVPGVGRNDPLTFNGLQIVFDRNMTKPAEDWSQVRSPSRALRRRAQGHPQRIRIIQVPRTDMLRLGNNIVVHPDTWTKIRPMFEQARP